MAPHSGLALALLMTVSTAAMAQDLNTAPAPSVKPPARAAAPANAFTIDQKGVKRTGDPLPDVDVSLDRPGSKIAPATARKTGPSNAFTIDQKGVKRTGDPLPDVDVSLGRPGSKVAPAAAK